MSARRGTGIAPLVERLVELLPEGPLLYPPEERTDAAPQTRLAELIREQVLRRTREEIPHAVEVMVTDVERREDGLVEIHAEVWAETESQKGILVGRGGKMVRDVGAAARRELERELGARVYLDLQVRSAATGAATRRCSTGSGSSEPVPSRLAFEAWEPAIDRTDDCAAHSPPGERDPRR